MKKIGRHGGGSGDVDGVSYTAEMVKVAADIVVNSSHSYEEHRNDDVAAVEI